MEWVFLCFGTILAVEVLLHTSFKRNITAILYFTRRSSATITSARISDHWKEKVLLHYAFKIFVNSMQLIVCLLLTAASIVAAHFLGNLIGMDLLSHLMKPFGIIISLVFASLYVFLRVKVLHVEL